MQKYCKMNNHNANSNSAFVGSFAGDMYVKVAGGKVW
jgi:hypothetical protein